MPEILRYPCRILRLEERFTQSHVSGFGDHAVVEKKSLGYFITFDIGLTIPCGPGKPEFTEGDAVRLSVEKL